MKNRILVVGRHQSVMDRVLGQLQEAGYTATGTLDGQAAVEKAGAENFDALLIGGGVPADERSALAARVTELRPEIIVVEVTGGPGQALPLLAERLPARSEVIRIVGICGSLRSRSTTRMALEIALEGAREFGVTADLIDLTEYELPFCRGLARDNEYPDDVTRLRQQVRAAKGLLLGTPEYHGGYSGVLKNALDLMGFDEFQGKIIGLVGVSGGAMGATGALSGLRTVGRTLHAWVIPDQASIPVAHKAFDSDGQLRDPQLAKRLRHVGRQVARFSFLHGSQQAVEFLRAWEEAQANPGGRAPGRE